MQDVFFYSSKIIWMIIKPDSLFVIMLTLTLICLLAGKTRIARKLLFLIMIATWVISLFPLGGWISAPLDTRFPTNPELPEQVDGIIVLGGAIDTASSDYWQQIETNESAERLNYFISLAQRYPQAKLVFTGGNASFIENGPSEAEIVAELFYQRGIDPSRLVLEKQSRNTAENITLSKKLVNPGQDENWLLITSAAHMPRSVGLFCKNDWPVIPFPVDHSSFPGEFAIHLDPSGHAYHLVWAIYQWVGLAAYYLTGKIDELLPSSCVANSNRPGTGTNAGRLHRHRTCRKYA